MYICMYVCIYVYMYICIYESMYVCMYVCMYMCTSCTSRVYTHLIGWVTHWIFGLILCIWLIQRRLYTHVIMHYSNNATYAAILVLCHPISHDIGQFAYIKANTTVYTIICAYNNMYMLHYGQSLLWNSSFHG